MGFHGSRWVFMVFHDSRLLFYGSRWVFHGSRLVFIVLGWFHGYRLVFHCPRSISWVSWFQVCIQGFS